jgi:hypothetical protein
MKASQDTRNLKLQEKVEELEHKLNAESASSDVALARATREWRPAEQQLELTEQKLRTALEERSTSWAAHQQLSIKFREAMSLLQMIGYN